MKIEFVDAGSGKTIRLVNVAGCSHCCIAKCSTPILLGAQKGSCCICVNIPVFKNFAYASVLSWGFPLIA